MKVIGLSRTDYSREYVAIVSHHELQLVSDRRYGDKELQPLKIGDEFDLGAGCDFRNQIQDACKRMKDAMASFESARATMMKFAVLIASQQDAPAGATGPTGCSP